jgi:hypothetical protein
MHQRIDMAKVDESDVDGDFLSLPDFSRSRVSVSASDLFLSTIHMDGIWMVNSPFAIRNLQKWAKPQLHSNSLISDTEPLVRSAHGLRLVYRIFGHQVKRLDHE